MRTGGFLSICIRVSIHKSLLARLRFKVGRRFCFKFRANRCAYDDDDLLKDIRVYLLADFFLMDELQDYAIKRFATTLDVVDISDGFVECVVEVYGCTTQSHCKLRDVVISKACSHLESLWEKKPFRELVRNCGEFAVDLIAKSLGLSHNFRKRLET